MTKASPRSGSQAAFLALDFATYIVDHYSSDPRVAERAARALESARAAGLPILHVVPGPMADQIHPTLAPGHREPVLAKSTLSAFAGTDLHHRLQGLGIGRIIIAGVATSGTVLSTARWAHDIGYQVAVCVDACADPDPEAHAALVEESVFPDSWLGLWRIARLVHSSEIADLVW